MDPITLKQHILSYLESELTQVSYLASDFPGVVEEYSEIDNECIVDNTVVIPSNETITELVYCLITQVEYWSGGDESGLTEISKVVTYDVEGNIILDEFLIAHVGTYSSWDSNHMDQLYEVRKVEDVLVQIKGASYVDAATTEYIHNSNLGDGYPIEATTGDGKWIIQ